MKTVIDAVNELQGFWSDNKEMIYVKFNRVWSFNDYSVLDDCSFNREEFNKCVDEMSSNYGQCNMRLVSNYKKAFSLGNTKPATPIIDALKPEISKDMETPLETPLDDNSRQAKVLNIGNILHNMSCSTADEDEQNQLGEHASYLWDLASEFGESEPTIVKPVYTQEMADSGELPSVGVDCMVKKKHQEDGMYLPCFIIGLNKGGDYLVFEHPMRGIEQHNIANGVYDFKPLALPIDLISGEAYKFDYMGKTRVGLYNPDGDKLMVLGSSFNVSESTNIIGPLVVPVVNALNT